MNSEKNQKTLSSSYAEIETYQNKYLDELNALSKIFITLSVAILGLTLSVLVPALKEKVAPNWFVGTWILLLITAIIGFAEIYSFSRRFKDKAEYLHGCMMSDVIVELKGSDEKLNEFLFKSDQAKKNFDLAYNWCVGLVAAQAASLFLAFLCLSVFVYKNFVVSLPVP